MSYVAPLSYRLAMFEQAYLAEVSRRLAADQGLLIVRSMRLTAGTNNQIYRFDLKDGTRLIVKQYFQDTRERLRREFDLLTVLKDKGFAEVPTPIARFDDLRVGVYSFVEGEHRAAAAFTNVELTAIADYLARLHTISKDQISQVLLPGFASALSLGQVIERIEERIATVSAAGALALHKDVRVFLQTAQVVSLIRQSLETVSRLFGKERMSRLVSDEFVRLSSVDFGPHNLLWTTEGEMHVLDFEYGGWDHPLRVIGDSLAHDQNQALSEAQKTFLIQRYLAQTSLPQEVMTDIYAFCLVSQIEWVMVLVTSLLPEKIAKLQHAKGSEYNIDQFLQEQIEKIQARLAPLEQVIETAKLVP